MPMLALPTALALLFATPSPPPITAISVLEQDISARGIREIGMRCAAGEGAWRCQQWIARHPVDPAHRDLNTPRAWRRLPPADARLLVEALERNGVRRAQGQTQDQRRARGAVSSTVEVQWAGGGNVFAIYDTRKESAGAGSISAERRIVAAVRRAVQASQAPAIEPRLRAALGATTSLRPGDSAWYDEERLLVVSRGCKGRTAQVDVRVGPIPPRRYPVEAGGDPTKVDRYELRVEKRSCRRGGAIKLKVTRDR